MKKAKPTITVAPVAWSGDKVLKYQASGEFSGRRIFGDPRATHDGAVSALLMACESFTNTAKAITEEINTGKYNQK